MDDWNETGLEDVPQAVLESLLGEDWTGEDLVHSLIAPSRYKNVLRDDVAGASYSLDMIRLKLKAKNEKQMDDAYKAVSCWMLPERFSHYTSRKIASYRDLFGLGFRGTSIAIGMSFINGKGKTDDLIGFIEYNPNKIGEYGIEIVKKLLNLGICFEPIRYDLAIDYNISRNLVRTAKDQRKYECVVSGSLTEYLGQRNKPGRVKVYDKKAESELDIPCTRVELTCSADWCLEEVIDHLPVVFNYENASFDGMSKLTRAFAMSVQANVANGSDLESWLILCEKRTRKLIRDAFKAQKICDYNSSCISGVMNQVKSIADGTWYVQNVEY